MFPTAFFESLLFFSLLNTVLLGFADMLRRDGVADAEIAKKEAERGRKRKIDGSDNFNGPRKRSRSASSYSSDSISTISTNLSRSVSPVRTGEVRTGQSQRLSNLDIDRKRRHRSRSTSTSYRSNSSHSRQRRGSFQGGFGTSRRPQGLVERSIDRGEDIQQRRKTYSISRSASYTSDTSYEKRRKDRQHSTDRSKRRRHSSRSPIDRGRDRLAYSKQGSRRTHSPTESRDRGEVIRNRKSMTPNMLRPDDDYGRHNHRPPINHSKHYSRYNDRYGSSSRDQEETTGTHRQQPSARLRQSERSLSPFSKRLALTQAMNKGR